MPTIKSHDTVGAVALDAHGNIAAATSTGGTLNKAPGRVGDSSLIGCGCYADNETAAASTTGWGEPMMKLVLAKWATDHVSAEVAPDRGAPPKPLTSNAASTASAASSCWTATAGSALAHNTPRMAWAWRTQRCQPERLRYPDGGSHVFKLRTYSPPSA